VPDATVIDEPVEAAVCESAFAVEGMFCGGCAATVERALRRLPGVIDVNVSFLGNAALVRHDSETVATDSLRSSIASLGYTTVALSEEGGKASQDRFVRDLRIRLGVAAGFGMWVMMASVARLFTDVPATVAWWIGAFSGVVSLPVLVFSGGQLLRLGWLGFRERVPGMESLILLATAAAVSGSVLSLSRGESEVWFDVPVMLIGFQLLARLVDVGARRQAQDAVRAMLDLAPPRARRVLVREEIDATGDNTQFELVPLRNIAVGDILECRAGERVPTDATLVNGEANIDTSLVSGESEPQLVSVGSDVVGGTLNIDGVLRLQVTKTLGDRRIDGLAKSVGRLLNGKGDLMRLADRVAARLVPALILAAMFAIVLALASGNTASDALARALAVLVVTCPCALSLAVPLVISRTAARAARHRVLLRDAAALEHAKRIDTVILDKTGTLTEGKPRVTQVHDVCDNSDNDVLSLAALAGAASEHPLMQAIRVASSQQGVDATVESQSREFAVVQRREWAGKGILATLADGSRLLAGSRRWLQEQGVNHSSDTAGIRSLNAVSEVCVAIDARFIGSIDLTDAVREDAGPLLESLQARGMDIILASGDTEHAVRAVGEKFGIAWNAAMSPEDKCKLVQQLGEQGRTVAFVGDGLNDGPALAAAPLGIASGGACDLARSAAAIAVLDDGLDRVDEALCLARGASRSLRRNVFWALIYNAMMLPAAVLGYIHPLMAILAMGASSMSVSLSSLLGGRVNGRSSRCSENHHGFAGRTRRQ